MVPVSRLEQKLVFLKGEYENVEISLIDWDGDYMIHGKSMKNSNFFEYFKSYNPMSAQEYNNVINTIRTGIGSMHIRNSKSEDCVIAYTPVSNLNSWFLVAYIPAKELTVNRSIDWMLLGIITLGLMVLLHFNVILLLNFNRKLTVAAEAANQANEAKSLFLSTMSHDIRTPMNAIIGMNEMILRDSRDEEILMYSESIRAAGNTLLGIINDILDFSKIEAGKMEIINVDYNFVSLLNDLVNMVRRKADEKGLVFKLEADKDIPRILHGDEIRIKQVITNILSNAVKYTKEGSVIFSISGSKCEDEPDHVILHVRVKDTGIGIKKEELNKLFVAFERIEEKKNRNIEGTGLGMAIAQNFLNMMGSKIQVESEYGKGSEFSFDLKQKVVDWEPIGEFETAYRNLVREREQYRVRFLAPKARILVVDDTEINLKVFVSLLGKTKIQIDTADSGDAGIALFKRNLYDLIFLDHMMPDKDGFEVIKELKRDETPWKDTPVIFLTASEDEDTETKGLTLGAMDFIRKPFVPTVLVLRVKHAVELIRLQKDLETIVDEKTKENENLFLHVVECLADAIDAKDKYTNGHSGRVAQYSKEIAQRYGYDEKHQEKIFMMGLLHDVGKIGVPDEVINKPGRLTDEEFACIKKHPAIGGKILGNIKEMPELAAGAKWHHERYDGKGYPEGLSGDDIPEEARIIAVADAYDAMTSNRSYRGALAQEIVRAEIEKGKRSQFDPKFADIMLAMIDDDKEYTMRDEPK